MVGPENDKIGQSIEYNTRMNKNKNILTVRLRKYLFLLLMADDGDPSFTFQCFQATYGTPVVPIDWSTSELEQDRRLLLCDAEGVVRSVWHHVRA
jgi:hypothetical protein